MALVVDGNIAAMARGRERTVRPGTVWIGDDGLVEKVTGTGQKAPTGFDAAPRVDVGDAVVYPGLIDLDVPLQAAFARAELLGYQGTVLRQRRVLPPP